MKYAIVDGQRREAHPDLSGNCPVCQRPMVAKCGEIKIWHWAHRGRRTCDPWWENETEWHRAWKGLFPDDWLEVVHRSESGEKHIADVKTDQGWVVEFQHSYLKPEERRARNAFYPKLVWVVDGARRKRDKPQFDESLKKALRVSEPEEPSVVRLPFPDDCSLLREWSECRGPVFFDFGEGDNPQKAALWCLYPAGLNRYRHVIPFRRQPFAALFKGEAFEKELDGPGQIVSRDHSRRRAEKRQQAARQPQIRRRGKRPESFQQYLARKNRRKRF